MVNAMAVAKTETVSHGDFQETDIGLIPKDWDVEELGNIGSAFIGLTYSPRDVHTDGTLVLRSSNVQNGRLRFDDNVFVKVDVPDRATVRENDILICVRNGSRDLIGKSAVIDAHAAGMAFGAFMGLYRSEHYNFLTHVFKSQILMRQIHEHLGATINQITNKSLNGFKAPIPKNPDERKKISDILNDADALIESLEHLISKKREIVRETSSLLLSGEHRLLDFTDVWRPVRMRDILRHPATYGIVTAGAYVRDGVKMIRGGDISDGRIADDSPMVSKEKSAEYKRTELIKNDVLIALVGYPGASAKISDDLVGANISRAVGLLRLVEGIDPDYVVQFLNSRFGRSMVLAPSAGSAQQVVNLSALNKLEFLIPEFPEQKAISRAIMALSDELKALEEKLEKATRLKEGMMQELLTGRIRLV